VHQQLLTSYIEQYTLKEHLNPDLLNCLRVYPFAPQQAVITALTEHTHLYLLVSGKAQISYHLANGKRSIIMMITPLATVGDMEIFEDQPYQMNVVTIEKSIFLGIRNEDVLRYGYNDPRFLRFIIQYMGYKMRTSGFHQLSYDLPLLNRLAIYLLSQPCAANHQVNIENKAIIADLLGTTIRHLNRVIITLENEGIIQWQPHSVLIRDRSKLQGYGEL
jgi:CRP/FNR family transcriptional regulator, putaive post-exponential-phase nitrogen-starvation regulator